MSSYTLICDFDKCFNRLPLGLLSLLVNLWIWQIMTRYDFLDARWMMFERYSNWFQLDLISFIFSPPIDKTSWHPEIELDCSVARNRKCIPRSPYICIYILVNRTHKHFIYMLQGPTNILKIDFTSKLSSQQHVKYGSIKSDNFGGSWGTVCWI